MPFYRCFIRGEHIPGEVIGSTGLYSFYTTRWVQAINRRRAELRAVEAVRRDPLMTVPEGVPRSDEARLHVEEIEQIPRLPRFRGGGAIWFAECDGSARLGGGTASRHRRGSGRARRPMPREHAR